MVCKEEVVSWFKESVSYKRLDLMCTLLNMCLPFELRFLGTCLEELGKRDFTELRETEKCANSPGDVGEAQCVSDKHTRRKLALYLALLHSANHGCSHVIYKTLANFDFAEIQTLLGNATLLEDENPLDELLLLYMMALNHPAFSYEQKSVFGSILMKLQDEEAKISYTPNKPALVCMKSSMTANRPMQPTQASHSHFVVCQPMYMPCTPSTDAAPGTVGPQYASAMKPILLPANLSNAGDSGKAMPMQEMPTGSYYPLFPNTGGPQSTSSVLFCMPPPHGMAQAVASPNTPSASEYACPQPSFMLPSMGGDISCQAGVAPVAVNNSLPSAANAEYTSPYRSPCGSPYGSPEASRSGSPGWCPSSTQAGNSGYKVVPQVPPRHGSSSSSSSCSGGSTGGYRSSRRNKQPHNGQITSEEVASQPSAEQMRLASADDHLRGMLANMTLANGLCSNVEQRQRLRDEKRRWMNPSAPPAQTQNSGSAGSSHSDSSSPPATPPQEEVWDTNKEEASKWEKMQGAVPSQLPPARGSVLAQAPPMRTAMGHTVVRRTQDMKQGTAAGRRPIPIPSYTIYTTNAQAMQPLRASTGAIFQAAPTFLGSTAIFSPAAMMPPPTSGPASFPPFTPNGITSPPPELLYNVPPSSQTSPPPPFPVQQYVPPKQNSSPPPPAFMSYAPSYPPPPLSANAKLTCYNCGGSNHRGTDCREPSIEEVMRRGHYRLDFNGPQSSIDVALPSQQQQQQQQQGSGSSSGGNPGTNGASEK